LIFKYLVIIEIMKLLALFGCLISMVLGTHSTWMVQNDTAYSACRIVATITDFSAVIAANNWEGSLFATTLAGSIATSDFGLSFKGTFGGAGLSYTALTANYVSATSTSAYSSTGVASPQIFTMTDVLPTGTIIAI
jgi:hypothetical protein